MSTLIYRTHPLTHDLLAQTLSFHEGKHEAFSFVNFLRHHHEWVRLDCVSIREWNREKAVVVVRTKPFICSLYVKLQIPKRSASQIKTDRPLWRKKNRSSSSCRKTMGFRLKSEKSIMYKFCGDNLSYTYNSYSSRRPPKDLKLCWTRISFVHADKAFFSITGPHTLCNQLPSCKSIFGPSSKHSKPAGTSI